MFNFLNLGLKNQKNEGRDTCVCTIMIFNKNIDKDQLQFLPVGYNNVLKIEQILFLQNISFWGHKNIRIVNDDNSVLKSIISELL